MVQGRRKKGRVTKPAGQKIYLEAAPRRHYLNYTNWWYKILEHEFATCHDWHKKCLRQSGSSKQAKISEVNMYIDDVQSVFTPGVVQNKQQNRQDVRAAASGRAPVGDTVSFSAEALELARSKAAAENSVQKREGESVLPQAEEANEAQARGSKSGKSLVSLMLDAMFMFALEEEEAEPSPLTRGDGETSEDASSPVTDNKPAEAQKLMDGMVQGKFDLSEMVDALAGLSSAKGVSGSTGQGAIRDKSDARGKPAE